MALNLEGLSAICPFYRCIAQKKNAELEYETLELNDGGLYNGMRRNLSFF
jgi:hypothetical protein